eukprot:1078167-Prymnesium_polylepis.1
MRDGLGSASQGRQLAHLWDAQTAEGAEGTSAPLYGHTTLQGGGGSSARPPMCPSALSDLSWYVVESWRLDCALTRS